MSGRQRESDLYRGGSKRAAALLPRQTIAELLDVPVESLEDDAYLASELDADSLMDVALVVEDAHRIRFSEPELASFTCLMDVAECARRATLVKELAHDSAGPGAVHACAM